MAFSPQVAPLVAEPAAFAANHPGGNPEANLQSISHKCKLFEVAIVWESTKVIVDLPLGCLQGGKDGEIATLEKALAESKEDALEVNPQP